MIQQLPILQTSIGNNRLAAARPLVVAVWVLSYLAIDLIMWAGGRSTLLSNIVVSLPMMLTAPALTMWLERLRRRLLHLSVSQIGAIIVPAAFGMAVVQLTVDYASVRFAAALLFPDWQAYVPSQPRQFGFGIYVYALHFLCCLLALTLLQTGQSMKAAVRQRTEAMSAHRRAEAKALRLQLNPHFLFNALNSIAALVATEGNRVADTMICRLSDFLRASITDDPESDVSLAAEIATIEAYLAIEQLRFGDRLSVAFSIAPDSWDAAIPAFLLQPLAENAVKHGLAAPRAAIRLTVEVRRVNDLLIIAVTDRCISPCSGKGGGASEGGGIGLANIRNRVALFGPGRATLDTERLEDGFCARLTLPYRRIAGASRWST